MQKFTKALFFFVLATLWLAPRSVAQTNLNDSIMHSEDDILGFYLNPDRSRTVEVYKEGGEYFGVIHSAPEEPDGSEGVGFVVFKEFEFDKEKNVWAKGRLHSPMYFRSKFSGILKLDTGGNLIVRGFVGIPLLGGDSLFLRVEPDAKDPQSVSGRGN